MQHQVIHQTCHIILDYIFRSHTWSGSVAQGRVKRSDHALDMFRARPPCSHMSSQSSSFPAGASLLAASLELGLLSSMEL